MQAAAWEAERRCESYDIGSREPHGEHTSSPEMAEDRRLRRLAQTSWCMQLSRQDGFHNSSSHIELWLSRADGMTNTDLCRNPEGSIGTNATAQLCHRHMAQYVHCSGEPDVLLEGDACCSKLPRAACSAPASPEAEHCPSWRHHRCTAAATAARPRPWPRWALPHRLPAAAACRPDTRLCSPRCGGQRSFWCGPSPRAWLPA